MHEFLIDNIFVMFGGRVFQQTIGIPMGTNCAPLLADLFLYSYEADCIQGLLKKNEKKLARSFNFTFRYIDYVRRWRTKLYDKRDDFNFPIVSFPFICSNIPAAPAYGVYISQLIWYSTACSSYQDFLDRGLLLTRKLLNQGFLLV